MLIKYDQELTVSTKTYFCQSHFVATATDMSAMISIDLATEIAL
jgi:hypothetical protein